VRVWVPTEFFADASPELRDEMAAIVTDFHPGGFRGMARTLAENDTTGLLPTEALTRRGRIAKTLPPREVFLMQSPRSAGPANRWSRSIGMRDRVLGEGGGYAARGWSSRPSALSRTEATAAQQTSR
jgi:hypothetical protein